MNEISCIESKFETNMSSSNKNIDPFNYPSDLTVTETHVTQSNTKIIILKNDHPMTPMGEGNQKFLKENENF